MAIHVEEGCSITCYEVLFSCFIPRIEVSNSESENLSSLFDERQSIPLTKGLTLFCNINELKQNFVSNC